MTDLQYLENFKNSLVGKSASKIYGFRGISRLLKQIVECVLSGYIKCISKTVGQHRNIVKYVPDVQ